jgi:hypothetical protein
MAARPNIIKPHRSMGVVVSFNMTKPFPCASA